MVILAPSLKIFCRKLIEIVLNNVLRNDMEVYQIYSFPNCVSFEVCGSKLQLKIAVSIVYFRLSASALSLLLGGS